MSEAYPTQNIDIAITNMLKGLLAPNAPDASTAQGNLGPATLTQVAKTGSSTADAVGPYQQGVAKALKDLGIQHTQEAVAQGADPIKDIQNHSIMQPDGSSTSDGKVDPIQTLTGLIATHLANKISDNQKNQQPQSAPQNNNYVPDNPISSFFNMLGITSTPQNQLLLTQAQMNRQKMAAGQPAEITLPASEAALKTGELTAGAPAANVALTKQQAAASQQDIGLRGKEIQAGIYKAQSERDIQNIQRLTDRRKQVLDQMNEDLQHGPIINRGKRLDTYRKQLDYYDIQLQKAGGNITQPSNGGYLKTGTLPDGRKVGVKADGTTEIING